MAAFDLWLRRYQGSTPQERAGMLDEGVRLAQKRAALLYDWIQTQPEQALQAALPMPQRRLLPAAITAHLEERIHARGELAVVAATPPPGGEHLIARPVFREARLPGKTYDAYVYGRRAQQDTKYGTSLLGIAVRDRMAVLDEPAEVLTTAQLPEGAALAPGLALGKHAVPAHAEPGTPVLAVQGGYYPVCCAAHAAELAAQATAAELKPGAFVEALGGESQSAPPPAAATSETTGAKSMLVIVAKFSDAGSTPQDISDNPSSTMTSGYISNRLNTDVSGFLQQMSYGKTSIGSVTVTSPLLMPSSLTSYATADNSAGLKADAINAAATAGHNTSSFDRIAVVFSNTFGIAGNKFTWSGLGDLGGNFTWFNGYFDMHVITHELGHNFGLRHANLWKIPGGSTNPVDPLGQTLEYGDPFDVMGSAPNTTDSFPNPYFSNRVNWLPEAAVQTITTSGTYRVHRYDHQSADLASTLALRLSRDNNKDYWIGYRRKYQSGSLSDISQGAYVLWSFNTETRSHLIDLDTPGSNTNDASLNVGQTFNDTEAGISFTINAAGGNGTAEYLDVNVAFQPRLVFSKSTYSVDEQAPSVVLTVERRNNSTGAVSAHFTTVNGSATAGSDFTATSGDLSWASGDATPRTITVPLINNAAAEGAEAFTVELSAITGAVTPSGKSVTVTIQESGALDTMFTPPFLGSAAHRVLSQPDSSLVVTGNFGATGTITSAGLVQLQENGAQDTGFDQGPGGSPLPLRAVARQADGKIVVGGDFTSLRSVACNRIARLNVDGTLDLTFNPGTGPNSDVAVIVIQPDGKILAGGNFTSWSGVTRRGLVRLNEDGSLDTSLGNLDSVVDSVGGDFEVTTIALQPVDVAPHFRILVGGFFQRQVADAFRSGLVALLPATGARDTGFDVSYGAHQAGSNNFLTSVSSLAVQPDRKVLVGGQFTGFNNVNCGHLVRLTSTGGNDSSFVSGMSGGIGGSGFVDVSGILVQGDGKIAVAGHFSSASSNAQKCLARYQASGAFDTGFRPAIATSGSLLGAYNLTMQPDGKIVIAFNGAGNGNVLKRFFSSLPQSPSILQFTSPSAIGQEGLSASLSVSRTGGSLGAVTVNYATVERSATAGADYTTSTGILSWADGDTSAKIISVPVTADATVENTETFEVRLGNPLGGAMLGENQSTVISIEAGDLSSVPQVQFATGSSSISENGGSVDLTLTASMVPATGFTVPFTLSGTAIKGAGKDYLISDSPVTFAAGETSKTISITALQNSVLAANKTIEITLNTPAGTALLGNLTSHTVTIQDDETAPVITTVPQSRIAAVGSNVTFTAAASGNPAPSFIWKKGTTVIAGQTGAACTLNNVQLGAAGTYSVTAKNPALSAPSSIVLGIVDKTPKILNLYGGPTSKTTLTAVCSTNITGFVWKRNNATVSNLTGHITGAGTKTLTITGLTAGDAGEYVCEVTCPGVATAETTGPVTMSVIDGPPVITAKPVVLPRAVVGGTYSFDVPYDHSANVAPTSFTATPLPAGLSINAQGHISGRVTAALTAQKTFAVAFKASNKLNSNTATGNLVVDPLPAGSVGSFTGLIARNPAMPGNDGLGGRIVDLTVATSGNITGTLIHGVTSHKFGGLLNAVPDNPQPTASIVIPRKNTTSLTLTFTIDSAAQRFINATITDGTNFAAVNAWRKVKPPATYPGLYNLGLHLASPDVTKPQGIGYASFTIAASGSLTVAGKLADGVSFSTATTVGPQGEVLVHSASATADTVLGMLTVTPGTAPTFADSTITGTVSWSRKTQPAGARLYASGFAPTDLNAVGARYVPSAVFLNLPYVAGTTLSNAAVSFTNADFGGPPALMPDVVVLVKTANGVSVLAPNPRLTSLKVSAATGAFSGIFSLTDANPLATSTNILRSKVPYQGLIYREAGTLVARGWFTLNNLPRTAGELSTTTKTVSGKVELTPMP